MTEIFVLVHDEKLMRRAGITTTLPIRALVAQPFVTVIIQSEDGVIYAFGISKQNPKDSWNLERGIKIAQVRAYRNYKATFKVEDDIPF